MKLSRRAVMSALARFDANGAPSGYGSPKRYWLVHPSTGKLYPQKAIYGMAKKLPQRDCPSAAVTRKFLEALDFEIFDEKACGKSSVRDFQESVRRSRKLASSERRDRLRLAPKYPERMLTKLIVFRRNPDVVAERLVIAKGICEECGAPAPFVRSSDGTPFLEVHHVVSLADGGEDTVDNTQALCPNCHRKVHFG